MRLEEEFVGRRLEYVDLLKKVAKQLEVDTLQVRGKRIGMPDEDMEYKISHKTDYGANKLTISIEWLDPQPSPPSSE